jgi:7-cyano-7-deazaguanine reductase
MNKMMDDKGLRANIPLGKQSEPVSVYTPSLLAAISRSDARAGLGINNEPLPFSGMDIWNAYELSWLNMNGKPEIALAEISIPCASPSLVESKSLKLYLNSLNQTQFHNRQEVKQTIETDLETTIGSQVMVDVHPVSHPPARKITDFPGDCLDELDVKIKSYQPDPELLELESEEVEVNESLYTHLFRSTCPVTGQPDWASIQVAYTGQAINRESLLKYLVSYREHQGFHEQCIEKIFVDIFQRCSPARLTVYGRFLRRGGLDINPYRTNVAEPPVNDRLVRQ